MATKRTLSEAEALEQYRVSFENVEKQTEIATIMAEFGYDETLLTEGKTLLTKTRQAFDFNKKESPWRSWKHGFSTCKSFVKHNGKIPKQDDIYKGMPVGNWFVYQKTRIKNETIISLNIKLEILSNGKFIIKKNTSDHDKRY